VWIAVASYTLMEYVTYLNIDDISKAPTSRNITLLLFKNITNISRCDTVSDFDKTVLCFLGFCDTFGLINISEQKAEV